MPPGGGVRAAPSTPREAVTATREGVSEDPTGAARPPAEDDARDARPFADVDDRRAGSLADAAIPSVRPLPPSFDWKNRVGKLFSLDGAGSFLLRRGG